MSAQLMQAAVAQSFNAVMVTSADLSGEGPLIEYCNAAMCDIAGYTEAELLGRSPRILHGPLTDRAVLRELGRCLEEGRVFQGAAINYRKNGETYWLEWCISPVRDASGVVRHFVAVQRDISERVQAEQERQLLAQALNATNDAILITDRNFAIVFVNRAFETLSGYTSAEVLGQTPMALLRSDAHDPAFYERLQEALAAGENFRATFTNRHKSGELYYAEQSIAPLRDASGNVSHYVGVSKDVSAMVLRESALREMANRDKLTGLLNRHVGAVELQRCQSVAQTQGQTYGLILGDIDHFKRVNDTFGHGVGDRVLQTVAHVLCSKVRSADHVVRWGGEEFLVILADVDMCGAMALAERIRLAVSAVADPDVGICTMSLGVAVWQCDASESALLDRADRALYLAKERGRNQVACHEREMPS